MPHKPTYDTQEIACAKALIKAAKLLEQVVVLERGAEPMVGDLVKVKETDWGACHYCGMDWLKLLTSEELIELYRDEIIEIIQRNNKPVIYKD